MGTTAEKLTYLNDTKGLLKDGINSLGGNITSQTTFRQYATELDSIYASLPKVSGTGSILSLSPTLKGRLGSTLKGNTFQQTYTGKNLWGGFSSAVTRSTSSVDFTNNADGSITANGLASANCYSMNTSLATSNNHYISLPAGTYTLSGATATLHLQVYDTSDNRLAYTTNTTLTSTFTTTETKNIYVRIEVLNGTNVNNETIYPLLETGSSATSYEPYTGGTASPNPSYPQDIQSVTGLQTITVCGKNLLFLNNIQETTTNGVTYSCLNGVIKLSGTATNGILINFDSFYLPAGTYTLKTNRTGTVTGSWQTYLRNSSGNIIQGSDTFTTTEGQMVYFRIYINSGVEYSGIYEMKPQLEKGSTATDYEPYQSQEYEINLGKNLFDKNNANILNALITNTGAINSNASTRTLYIPCNPNTTYTISKISSPRFVIGTTENIPSVGSSTLAFSDFSTGTSGTITTGNNAHYLLVYYYNSSGTATQQEILDSIQIEIGNEATPYSPYFTPIHLRKSQDGTYQDYITGSPNNWSIKRQIGSIVLNGTETGWDKLSGVAYNTYIIDNLITANRTNDTAPYLSNYFTAITNNQRYVNNSFFINSNNRIIISYDDITTLANFKTWLSTHNTKVVYELATPTTEPITNTELIEDLNNFYNAKSYNGQTNISVEGDLSMILDVSAIKGE